MKKIISLILAVLMIVTVFPLSAFANQKNNADTQQQIEYQATDAIGDIILDAADFSNSESAANAIQNVSVSGKTATVELKNTDAGTLIVAIYDNDGKIMLGSGKTDITASETEQFITAEIEIATDEMPRYFYLKAFFVDSANRPLCKQYETIEYTKKFEEFMAKTTADFDKDYIINLDDSEKDNFLVISEDAVVIKPQQGENTVAEKDFVNGLYIIENADEEVKNLRKNDVLYYPYSDDDYILTKIGSIDVNGDTVTIEGASPDEITDFFQYAKVNLTQKKSTIIKEEPATFARLSRVIDVNPTMSETHSIEITVGAVTGKLDLTAQFNFRLYIDADLLDGYVEIAAVYQSDASLAITIKGQLPEITLPVAIVGFDFDKLDLSANVKVAVVARVEMGVTLSVNFAEQVIGFSYTSDSGMVNKCKSPTVSFSKPELATEGTVFVGIALQLDLQGFEFIEVLLEANAGLQLDVILQIIDNTDDHIHECSVCFAINVYLQTECFADIKIPLDLPVEGKITFVKIMLGIGERYLSVEEGFGEGKCPGIRYKVTVNVSDNAGESLSGVTVNEKHTTDSDGQAVLYLPNGEHSIVAKTPEGFSASEQIFINENPKTVNLEIFRCKVTVIVNDNEGKPISGATVNGKYTTNSSGFVYFYLGKGDHKISAKHEDVTAQKNITISNETEKTVSITISKSKIIVTVTDESGKPLSGAKVNNKYTTDENGVAEFYLTNGTHTITVKTEDGLVEKKTLTVNGEKEIPVSVFMRGNKCGDDLVWEIRNDELIISGTGEMYDYKNAPDNPVLCAPWYTKRDSIKKVTIENGATSIGDYAFMECKKLESIAIPDSMVSIRYGAFQNCNLLADITLPDCVKTIESSVFYNCLSLTEMIIPASVTSIRSSTFTGCNILKSITIPDSVTSIGDKAFYGCRNLTDITIPDSVKSIGYSAFEYCVSLTGITIPDGVTSIEKNTFKGCSLLESVIIPDSVTSIGTEAFAGCYVLSDITIPEKVTSIGEKAFYDCHKLPDITIPAGVTTIGNQTFYRCNALTDITIPAGVTSIGTQAFNNCTSLASITIPDSVTSLGENAFSGCSSLTDIHIPTGVTTIGNGAFSGCNLLTELTIPESVTSVGNMAFMNCKALVSITIPDSVTSIGDMAFYYCNALETVYYTGSEASWNKISIGSNNNDLKNAAIIYNYTVPKAFMLSAERLVEDMISKTVTDAVAGNEYMILVVRDANAENLLAAENLLFIDQKTSYSETLTFEFGLKDNLTDYTVLFTSMNITDVPHEHTPGEWEVVVEAQVGADGKEQQKCTECGEVLDERIIPALPDEPDVSYKKGDANGDGKITAGDARIVLRISAQLEKVDKYTQPFDVFDVNGDGKISASDARIILRVAAKLQTL